MADKDENFFNRLTKLFSSGPAIQKFVRQSNYKLSIDAATTVKQTFQTYGRAFGAESKSLPTGGRQDVAVNRMARYAIFETMDMVTPEISKALDVYADEIAGADDRGKNFHIFCEKPEVKRALNELFYEVMDIENTIRSYIRNFMKFGDFFLFHEVIPGEGIVAIIPLPTNGIERLEGHIKEDPFAVQFKSIVNKGITYENWQVTHFRLLSNSIFLPYGTSILDPIRRTWDQLCMAEDSMLTYRVVRSPEKRQIFVEVGASADKDIPSYMEQVKSQFRSLGHADPNTGRVDYRYNPGSVEQDIFIPQRQGVPLIKIESLPANVNATNVEDIAYLQNKMFAGLGVPKPYLNYDDNLSSKATLAQSDIRFSRTISALQKEIISQFEKIAAIHLYAKGFVGDDLINFKFKFSNPSSVAVQQRLSLWSTKFDTVQKAKDQGVVDLYWIQKNILELGDDEVAMITRGMRIDKLRASELESLAIEDGTKDAQVSDNFDGSGYGVPDTTGQPSTPVSDPAQAGTDPTRQAGLVPVSNKPAPQVNKAQGFTFKDGSGDKTGKPVFINRSVERSKHNSRRRMNAGEGAYNLSMPDFGKMLSADNKYSRDIFGVKNDFKNLFEEDVFEIEQREVIPIEEKFHRNEIVKCLGNFDKSLNIKRHIDGRIILTEEENLEELEEADETLSIIDEFSKQNNQ